MLKQALFSVAFLSIALAGPVSAQRLELTSIPQPVDRPVGGQVETPDAALVRSVADWISNVFGLPEMRTLPTTRRFQAGKFALLPSKSVLSDRLSDTVVFDYQQSGRKVVAHYDDATKMIFLSDGWKGSTPAEMSVLVHAMVHHFQNVSGRTNYDCPEERKALPYEAQERWLGLYGRSLREDFKIEPATLMLITQCMP